MKILLKSLGFDSVQDFVHSTFRLLESDNYKAWSVASAIGGLITFLTGLKSYVLFFFVVLIIFEFWTGLRVSMKIRKQKIQSRKMWRMFIKICIYVFLLTIINGLSKQVDVPKIGGFEMNPLVWLYYAVFVGIIFQLVVSVLENLANLGYKETSKLIGPIIRKTSSFIDYDNKQREEEEMQKLEENES